MAMGRAIFDYFRYPDENVAIIHVLEYSRDHLDWQINKAGFTRCRVEYSQMHHSPPNPSIGNNLVAPAYAPADTK